MKTLRILAVTAAVFAAGSTFAAPSNLGDPALSLSNLSVGVEAGTTGYGVNFGYAVNPSTSLNIGWAGGSFPNVHGDSLNVGHRKYKANYSDLQNTSIVIKYSPFTAQYYNWFNVQFGTYIQDSSIKLTSNDRSIVGKVSTGPSVNPYLGFGFAPKIDDHWGVNLDLGVIYQGQQQAKLRATNAAGQAYLDSHFPGEDYNLADQYKWSPVAKAGVSYRF
ncbi:hypothetical protein [Aquirhabdus parva]|uniref:Outer membrane protein beta-barrel domain-containing protein n=1 Tax=Aquirhabdus parva TaxID=2283318 RepID=A0A345P6U8_9GAMM|nr:hypothetical protein [Aquirhabdus parva]AXI03007.1 hypothetical protein HYN46_09245 [Aquirhabdus parva]